MATIEPGPPAGAVTDATVDAGLAIVYEEGWPPYGPARVQDYLGDKMFHEATAEEMAAFRAADADADRRNREWMRRILEAAAPHLAAAARERCAQLAQGEAAKYRAVGEDWANLGAGALEGFAALLREQP